MRRYRMNDDKRKHHWITELLDCLEEAKRRLEKATTPEEHSVALALYRKVVEQLNALVLDGTVPPMTPCYSE